MEADALLHDWDFFKRAEQTEPQGDWRWWLYLAGRGSGKTRTGAEWIRQQVKEGVKHLSLIGATAADVRDVMVEGESGILAVSYEKDYDLRGRWIGIPLYEPSKRRLTWMNGAVATCFSADEPSRLRGPQSGATWMDELSSWRYHESFENADFGLRLGNNPRGFISTTPKPVKLIRDLVDGIYKDDTAVTRGSTFENVANLAPSALRAFLARYEGTRIGRQELYAEILTEVEGALWTRDMIEACYMPFANKPESFARVVVGVDPPAKKNGAECGIVVVALGHDRRLYVLQDASRRGSPNEWAQAATMAYHANKADLIVGEVNNGGDMVGSIVANADRTVPFKAVHASRGKDVRAEPVAMLYEQNRVSHVGSFAEIETQMTNLTRDFSSDLMGYSPDRLDALVWAVTELALTGEAGRPRIGVA